VGKVWIWRLITAAEEDEGVEDEEVVSKA
jgi:hypothetical protein